MTEQHERAAPDLLVADSWLVEHGRVRAIDRHLRRFAESCAPHGIDRPTVEAVFARVVAETPTTGRWFPRVELRVDRCPTFVVRPASPRLHTCRLRVAPGPDPRRSPRVKGPDLELLSRLRAFAQDAGADEALLVDHDGAVLEGAFSAIVWWRGDDLCIPHRTLSTLPSVTRAVIVDRAERDGIAVREERCRPFELQALDTWSLSALHGIRPVIGWVGADRPPTDVARLRWWQRAIDEQPRGVHPARGGA